MQSGVYKIQNIKNGKMYIGSAKDLPKRKSHHFWHLRKGIHGNSFLQSAYNKYGEAAFNFEIVIVCSPEDRVLYEQKCIDLYKSANNKFGYNLRPLAESNDGLKWTDEQKQKARIKCSSPEVFEKWTKNKSGDIHNGITLIKRVEKKKTHIYWLVRCHCGREYVTDVGHIRARAVLSCGCNKKMRFRKNAGFTGTKEYKKFSKLMMACTVNDVCQEWVGSFKTFLSDMGIAPDGTYLAKRNSFLPYSKDNCLWATRCDVPFISSHHKFVMVDGKKLNVTDAAKDLGVSMSTFWTRSKRKNETYQQVADHFYKKKLGKK